MTRDLSATALEVEELLIRAEAAKATVTMMRLSDERAAGRGWHVPDAYAVEASKLAAIAERLREIRERVVPPVGAKIAPKTAACRYLNQRFVGYTSKQEAAGRWSVRCSGCDTQAFGFRHGEAAEALIAAHNPGVPR